MSYERDGLRTVELTTYCPRCGTPHGDMYDAFISRGCWNCGLDLGMVRMPGKVDPRTHHQRPHTTPEPNRLGDDAADPRLESLLDLRHWYCMDCGFANDGWYCRRCDSLRPVLAATESGLAKVARGLAVAIGSFIVALVAAVGLAIAATPGSSAESLVITFSIALGGAVYLYHEDRISFVAGIAGGVLLSVVVWAAFIAG